MSAKDDRKKFLREAELYESMREDLGKTYLENFKFMKTQLSEWYVTLTAVCFAIGGIAITVGIDKTSKYTLDYPHLFWWGSILLILNGIFIFFFRKIEFEGESRGFIELKQKEADLWTMSKIAKEHADGDNSRVEEFTQVAERFQNDYDNHTKTYNWLRWVRFVFFACMLDIVFGFMLFPLLMLASQLIDVIQFPYQSYVYILKYLLLAYILYIILQIIKVVRERKLMIAADDQIKAEVNKKRQ